MKALKSSGTLTVLVIVGCVALAVAFWLLLLGPKRDEAAKLGKEVEQVEASLAQHRSEVAAGKAARRQFPADYRKLVVLGKAVPGDDDTASLLVQVTHVAAAADVEFRDIELTPGTGEAATASAATASGGEPVSPTEAAASLLPLGASIGSAGLGAMPYTLVFTGNWFQMADFIQGLDSLVETENEGVAVDGRLVTIDGFSLEAAKDGLPRLQATFAVTTFLTPPEQGVTAGATPQSPAGLSASSVESTP